ADGVLAAAEHLIVADQQRVEAERADVPREVDPAEPVAPEPLELVAGHGEPHGGVAGLRAEHRHLGRERADRGHRGPADHPPPPPAPLHWRPSPARRSGPRRSWRKCRWRPRRTARAGRHGPGSRRAGPPRSWPARWAGTVLEGGRALSPRRPRPAPQDRPRLLPRGRAGAARAGPACAARPPTRAGSRRPGCRAPAGWS